MKTVFSNIFKLIFGISLLLSPLTEEKGLQASPFKAEPIQNRSTERSRLSPKSKIQNRVTVNAEGNNPNNGSSKPESGWSLWRPKSEIEKAGYVSGFSNIELGGYLDFENACTTNAGKQSAELKYWFRLSNSLDRLGTGEADYGCWLNGRFLHTYSMTATKDSAGYVTCLRVNTLNKKSLIIRDEPTAKGRQIGVVANGRKVTPSGHPASIILADGQNWIAISSPKEGWISDGSPSSKGNLRLCNR